MDAILITGIIGSLIVVTGAAWPDRTVTHPTRSLKNWLFAAGGAILLLYALLSYLEGGPIFFVFLQILVAIASVLMMLNTPDRIDTPIIMVCGLALIVWSFYLFEDLSTIIFVFGLCGIGLGYAFDAKSLRRGIALTVGSILIALFSYLAGNWIFLWLNLFFALFSGYYLMKSYGAVAKSTRMQHSITDEN